MTLACLPIDMSTAIAMSARTAGKLGQETGGFIIANDCGESVTLALAGQRGIERAWNLFRVSSGGIATLFDWVAQRGLTVSAQWHSHRRDAFLSEVDIRYGFNVTDFRTCVVPNYASPSDDPTQWGWWTFDGHRWRDTNPPTSCNTPFNIVTFEEGEIHEH